MALSVIDQVVAQLAVLPQPLQQQVLQFAQKLGQTEPKGVSGSELLEFAGTISSEDLSLMQEAIEQDCERVDLDGW